MARMPSVWRNRSAEPLIYEHHHLMHLTDRISLLEYCNRLYYGGIAVEVGAASGCFTRQILASWPTLKTLHCVDLWAHQKEGYHDDCNLPDDVQQERYERFQLDFGEDPRVVIVRQWSHIAATLFAPESLSFVYLDANHSTAGAASDLRAWWPAVKRGGIMAGHDYCAGNGEGYGVKAAVDAFAKENNLEVMATTKEFGRESGVYGASWEGASFAIMKE